MTDLSASRHTEYKTKNKIRFVTAASLFDGHDAAINIMRRILQASGAEVIHLGHNRAVDEVVTAALQEDVQGIAVSSYQGGHVEYFKYMIDLLRERGGENIKVFGGGGGVIVADEIRELQAYGVARIYTPEDGQKMGLQGMINDMLASCDEDLSQHAPNELNGVKRGDRRGLARLITALENGATDLKLREQMLKEADALSVPVLGVTGTGGSGKSSLADELVRRFRLDQEDRLDIAILAVDPSRRKSGGALLGDRIRMNAIAGSRVFMRSLATRGAESEISKGVPDVIAACKVAGFDLVLVETSGIGQGDAAIVPLVDASLYVMTPEYGAASQLEKIDMLDFADFVVINKFDRKGGEDALRDVRKQYQRNRKLFDRPAEEMPVYGTIASRFNDDDLCGRRAGRQGARAGDPHSAQHDFPFGDQGSESRAARLRGPWRDPEMAHAREPARLLPVHRRRILLQARERGSDAHVRGRGRSFPHQPPLPPAVERHAGKAPLDRVRFGDALRIRPGPAPGYLRQGRQLGRVHRHAGRHESPLLGLRPVRSGDERQHDDQRAGADDPRDVPEHRHRPANRQIRGEQCPRGDRRRARGHQGTDAFCRSRHGASGYPQGGSGAEHLHLLDRVLPQSDGRHPGILHRSRRAQFLLRLHLGLSHRGSRREPDLAARLYARQRLHFRRGLPGARNEDRRFCAEPFVFLQLRHGARVRRARPRGAAHLGGGDAGEVRRERAQPEAQVPFADLRALAARPGNRLQRHPHHPAGADLDLRQHQFAAHQRLR